MIRKKYISLVLFRCRESRVRNEFQKFRIWADLKESLNFAVDIISMSTNQKFLSLDGLLKCKKR